MACCKRYTVEAPIPGNPAYRKDINLGTQGILLAWAADDHSKAQVQVDLEVPRVYKEKVSGKKVIKHTARILGGKPVAFPYATASNKADIVERNL